MPAEYQQYKYHAAEPGTEYQRKLAGVFVSLVRKLRNVESVCDLGSGNGYLANQLSAVCPRVTGIDGSQSGVGIASKNFGTNKVSFVCSEIKSDIVKSHLGHERFDAVVSSDVIEHMYRPSDLVETAAQLLRPGGYLVLGTPYHGYLKNFALGLLNRWDAHHAVDWDGGHIKFFSVDSLRKLVTHYGFHEPQFHFSGRVPYLWKNMICVARNAR